MPNYTISYVHGFLGELRRTAHGQVKADSIRQALAAVTAWPVEQSRDNSLAWAKHPGTSLYYVEAWEAELRGPDA